MHEPVSAPALRAAKNGLVDAGNKVNTGDERWEAGVVFTPRGCQAIYGHSPACPSEDKSPPFGCRPPVVAEPWLLEVALEWQMADLAADPKDMLTEAMKLGTSAVLERLTAVGVNDTAAGTALPVPALSGSLSTTGVTGRVMAGATQPPTLFSSALDAGSGATTAATIGILESKLLDAADHIGSGGTLLMSPWAAATADMAIEHRDGKLVTRATESAVIVGNFAPIGTIYAVIGEVDVYLSEVFNVEFNERHSNSWIGRAERRALAVWNLCGVFHAAVGGA
jgi:hypothetical protein